jgi:DNA-binding response OmpR family regulator
MELRSTMHVLLAGAYQPLVKALRRALVEEGFTVDIDCHTGSRPAAPDYDAAILDLGRSDDAASVLHAWRQAGLNSPVFVLTSPGQNSERPNDVDLGRVLWLVKPFSLESLLNRLRRFRPARVSGPLGLGSSRLSHTSPARQ